MSSPLPTSAPTNVACERFSDFDRLAEFFVGWDGRIEQLSAGGVDGTLRRVQGQTVRAVATEFNRAVLVRGRVSPGLYAVYLVTPRNAASLWQGRRLEAGRLVVHGPGGAVDHCSARNVLSVGASVPAGPFEQAARSLVGADEVDLPTWSA